MSLRQVVALLAAAAQALPVTVALGSDESTAAAQANRIASSLDVTFSAGAAGDESLAHGVYVFRLKCSADLSCGFERLTLNECAPSKDRAATFSPRADYWSTASDLLAVKRIANDKIELTVYQAFGRKLPATVTLTFAAEQPPFKTLTDFKTAGFIDMRFWPDIGTRIEYVPVRHDRAKVLDCPVSLRGLTP
jgi:hypothetical protein